MASSVSIGMAKKEEAPAIMALLESCELPQDGLSDHLATTLVARYSGNVVGSAALELYGENALLRSVAVEESMRGQGLGRRLTASAMNLAKQHGVAEIYLLTQTASSFFSRFGFKSIPRSDVPYSVQNSVEFTKACPVTALVMKVDL